MDSEIVDHYQTAAKVHALCREKARRMIEPGIKLLDIANEIESLAEKHGCGNAFPLNLSLNDIAAHYTPKEDDELRVQKGDVLKVDIGVHRDGYIVDAAITLDFSDDNEVANLVSATQAALEAGFAHVKLGVEVQDLGEAIEQTLRARGVDPIENLSGHGVDQYTAHCSPTIPNVKNGDTEKLEDNQAYAMEPFGSIHGRGSITDSPEVEIFEVAQEGAPRVRNPNARKLWDFCVEEYSGLPFAERWVARDLEMSSFARKIAMRELIAAGAMEAHSVLKEARGARVAQFETTFLINEGTVIRLV